VRAETFALEERWIPACAGMPGSVGITGDAA